MMQPEVFAARTLDAASAHAKIAARGIGHGVRVNLSDGTQRKGVLVQIGDASFDLAEKGETQPAKISYEQVTGVHRTGLSTGQKVGIGVGAALVAISITAVVVVRGMTKAWFKPAVSSGHQAIPCAASGPGSPATCAQE